MDSFSNTSSRIGCRVIALESIDSTNRYAKTLAGEDAVEGTVVIAEEQYAGKGRMGRPWVTAKGKNLTFSVILRPVVPMEKIGMISIMTAVAVLDALEANGITAETKWPNDILLRGKKVCGILCETAAGGAAPLTVVAGIGLNVNQVKFPPEIEEHASSLMLHAQKTFIRAELFRDILLSLDRWYTTLQQQNFRSILLRWKQSCVMLGKEVALVSAGGVIQGTALDVADDGCLLIHTGEGVEKVYAGDVTVMK